MDEPTPTQQFIKSELKALEQNVSEGTLHTFQEHQFVMRWVLEADRTRVDRDGATLSQAELRVVERLAWALYDATYGYGDRVSDDLQGIEDDLSRAHMD